MSDARGADGGTPGAPTPPPGLRRFLDGHGRLKSWPVKREYQRAAMAWLAAQFEPGRDYTEKQVNEVLNRHHAFGDWALLRRALVDHRWLERASDGSRYRRAEPPPEG